MKKFNATLKRSLLSASLASTVALSASAQLAHEDQRRNPLLIYSALPFSAPQFEYIVETDYKPALYAAIDDQRDYINHIVINEETPTFENTILVYERSGVMLDRVLSVFHCLTSAHKTPIIAETEKEITPVLTDWQNKITFNEKLFARIKHVYDHERNTLKGEYL